MFYKDFSSCNKILKSIVLIYLTKVKNILDIDTGINHLNHKMFFINKAFHLNRAIFISLLYGLKTPKYERFYLYDSFTVARISLPGHKTSCGSLFNELSLILIILCNGVLESSKNSKPVRISFFSLDS